MRNKFLFIVFLLLSVEVLAYDLLQDHEQALVVTTPGWDDVTGTLEGYEKIEGQWIKTLSARKIVVGCNGMAWGRGLYDFRAGGLCKEEGDHRAPAGIFSLGTAFGFWPYFEGNIDYFVITPTVKAVDDPASLYYNQIVDEAKVTKDWKSCEDMDQVSLYEFGLVIDHNMFDPLAGKGSAIFMHIWKASHLGTEGCTALKKEDLLDLLFWLNKNKSPVIIQLPQHIYDQYSFFKD